MHVVGSGLLGTSIGLALARRGVTVWLSDVAEENVRVASGLGAGTPWRRGDPAALVVVAVPPDHVPDAVADALASTDAVVTDVGSVKSSTLRQVRQQVDPGRLGRYVGSHPMAGSERSGPLAASASLFDGRPWAVTPHASSAASAREAVLALATGCGATPVLLDPAEHDLAVARISHVPHLLAVLVAGRLAGAPAGDLALSGQGVRDVTRVAGGDPGLWQQIIAANAEAVAGLLGEVRGDLDRLLAAVEGSDRGTLGEILGRGVAGTRAIPGKHGGPPVPTAPVFVSVPDRPGELARLFADIDAAGVNVEDLRIDHDPGRETGLAEVTVTAGHDEALVTALGSKGWVTHR